MKLYRHACLYLAASLPAPAYAGASGYWVAPPAYNAHYCPSATSVEPGGTVTLNARANSCTSGQPAEDLDTYKDLNGNKMTPPGGPDEERDSLLIEWTITGPDGYVETFGDFTWEWCAPCTPGTYTVKWRLTDGRDDGDPRRDGPVSQVLGTITVTALPEVSITKPACEGEYVSGISEITAFSTPVSKVAAMHVYVDDAYEGAMTRSANPNGDAWLYFWNTASIAKGEHTIRVRAYNTNGCPLDVERPVYAHPTLYLTQISFEQDHLLWDRNGGILYAGADITRPQWTQDETKPICYTRDANMAARPKISSGDISGAVKLRCVYQWTWSDGTFREGELTTDNALLPYDYLVAYRKVPAKMGKYSIDLQHAFYVRKCTSDDWCPAGTETVTMPTVYVTHNNPVTPWSSTQPIWTDVIDAACRWVYDELEENEPNETEILTRITNGLHSRTSGEFKYHTGTPNYTFTIGNWNGQTFYLGCFLNAMNKQGDCKDFAYYLCLLAKSIGVDANWGVMKNPPGFFTKPHYRAGQTDRHEDWFFHHAFGRFTNVFDAAIRFTSTGDPPSDLVENDGSSTCYKSLLVKESDPPDPPVSWVVDHPTLPQINRDRYPLLNIPGIRVVSITPTSGTVEWMSIVPATSQVHYDTVSHPTSTTGAYSNHTTVNHFFPSYRDHSVPLPGLQPNTTYYFRVESSGSVSPEQSFQTSFEE